jgi:hypothetical protein
MEDSELNHLMGTYYHEDFESEWSGLAEYLADDPPEDQRQLLREIDLVLADTTRDDAELGVLLRSLGNHVNMSREPGGYRGWLEEIARRVRAHLGE